MKQNSIDIVKKFFPYTKTFSLDEDGLEFSRDELASFRNAVECARIFIANAKLICPYVSRKDKDSVAEFRSPDYQFVDYWIEIENELNNLTLEDIK